MGHIITSGEYNFPKGELRKYTLGDRAGTEELNDDRIASECSQRVHLNIPQV